MTDDIVDFRNPKRVPEDIGQMFSQWQQNAREAIELRWCRCIPGTVKISPTPPAPITGAELRDFEPTTVTYRIEIVDTGQPALLMFCRPLALALVGAMLGESTETPPADRELTDIENTCLDFLVDEFRSALQASQKLHPPQRFTLAGRLKLKEVHSDFPSNATNTRIPFQVELPDVTDVIQWIVPQDATLNMISLCPTGGQSNAQSTERLEQLVMDAQLDMSVRLGTSITPLTTLANLKPGDVIVLDQHIQDPLVAVLGGLPFFRGWGGRLGNQQAFQIGELIDEPAHC